VQSGRHAHELRCAGADLVAVGTESFRDPLAGATVAEGLAELEQKFPANSRVDNAATARPARAIAQ
jgi:dihydroorotate dehydrogenase (NAD+) catalytic subunit